MAIVPPKIRGVARVRILRAHRVLIFLKAIDDYYAGRVGSEYLLNRADKMMAAGLPPVRNKTAKKWKK